jgi:hypothetical protein
MRQALVIFAKDVRHRRWPIVVLLALAAVRCGVDVVLPRHPELMMPQMGLGAIYVLWASLLVYAAVQEERVIGDSQYWLARPFQWWSVLLAKGLFAVAIGVLPLAVSGFAALAANGVVWRPNIAGPLAVFCFMATLATVIRRLSHLILVVFGYVTFALLFQIAVVPYLAGYVDSGGIAQDLQQNVGVVLSAIAAAAVMVMQYRHRRTGTARLVLAGWALWLLVGLPGWHWGFALEESLHGPGPSQRVRIAYDAARAPQGSTGAWSYWSADDVVGVEIPIVVTGIPPGMQAREERIRTTIEAPDGRRWDSGWRVIGGIFPRNHLQATQHRIPEDGVYWLNVNIDQSFYNRAKLKDTPVRLRTRAAMLLSRSEVAHLPVPSVGRRISADGFCSALLQGGELTVPCVWAPAGGTSPEGRVRVREGSELEDLGSTWGADGLSGWGLWSGSTTLRGSIPAEVEVETRRLAGLFERELDIRELRLGRYEVGRSSPDSGPPNIRTIE